MRKHKVSNISKCLTLSCWRSPLNRINLNVIQPCIIYASQIICEITHSFFLFSFFDLSTRKNCVLISINEFKANRTELHSNWKSFLLIGHNSFCDLIFFGWLVLSPMWLTRALSWFFLPLTTKWIVLFHAHCTVT